MTILEQLKSIAGVIIYIKTPNELAGHLRGKSETQIEVAKHLIKKQGYISIEVKGPAKTTSTLIILNK